MDFKSNRAILRFTVSTDHLAKKTRRIEIPFSFYLQVVQNKRVNKILPADLNLKLIKAREDFKTNFAFLSEDDRNLYLKTPYIRTLCGPDLYKFFVRVLSVNYQQCQQYLKTTPGSLEEFFEAGAPFWNSKLLRNKTDLPLDNINDAVFFLACIESQMKRHEDKELLEKNLDAFANEALKEKQDQIARLENHVAELEQELEVEREKARQKIVLVPGDPYHMLGLEAGKKEDVDERATSLIKVLHPDRSGTKESAYLFDMILKARDQILKKD